jgi:hypothetical protein
MNRVEIEKLKDIAAAGGSSDLAESLLSDFRDLAQQQGCDARLLKHGVLFQRGSGNALFTVYFSRTTRVGTVEIALAQANIERLYRRTRSETTELIAYLTSAVGTAARSPTSQQYPRVAVSTSAQGHAFLRVLRSFFLGEEYRAEAPVIPNERLGIDKRVLAAIWSRRGQPEFRENLLRIYKARCALTQCDVQDALEAAHIIPFSEKQDYSVTNGILLRSDIHTLFDLFLLSIDPGSWRVRIASTLRRSYSELAGKAISLPNDPDDRPDPGRLARHYQEWQKRHGEGLSDG